VAALAQGTCTASLYAPFLALDLSDPAGLRPGLVFRAKTAGRRRVVPRAVAGGGPLDRITRGAQLLRRRLEGPGHLQAAQIGPLRRSRPPGPWPAPACFDPLRSGHGFVAWSKPFAAEPQPRLASEVGQRVSTEPSFASMASRRLHASRGLAGAGTRPRISISRVHASSGLKTPPPTLAPAPVLVPNLVLPVPASLRAGAPPSTRARRCRPALRSGLSGRNELAAGRAVGADQALIGSNFFFFFFFLRTG